MTRFRGMISTQPGSTPLTSFKILSLDDVDGHGGCSAGTEIGEDSFDWFIDEVRHVWSNDSPLILCDSMFTRGSVVRMMSQGSEVTC